MISEQGPRIWTGVRQITYEWKETESSTTMFDEDHLGEVVEREHYDQMVKERDYWKMLYEDRVGRDKAISHFGINR